MFDDEEYFKSYDALATRIEPVSDEINWRGTLINLEKTMLTRQQLQWVAARIHEIYEVGYGKHSPNGLSNNRLTEIVNAVDTSRYRIAKPRLLCRVVVDELERARQGHAEKDTEQIISQAANRLSEEEEV